MPGVEPGDFFIKGSETMPMNVLTYLLLSVALIATGGWAAAILTMLAGIYLGFDVSALPTVGIIVLIGGLIHATVRSRENGN